LTLDATYGVQIQHLPSTWLDVAATMTGPRNDVQHTLALGVVYRLLSWLTLWARYDFLLSGSDAPAGVYRRNQALLGVAVHYDWERSRTAPPSLQPRLAGRWVTFSARLAPGQHAAVVGDWNGWDASVNPLLPASDGTAAAAVLLPPGRHEYGLSVDGVTIAPPAAPAYVADGFGGKSGVIVVP
jgi:hypothetical protein